MKNPYKIALFICLVFMIGVLIPAAFGGDPSNYRTYVNKRFSYIISYPSDILIPQGEAANHDGQRFISKDGRVEMAVYGTNNVSDESIEEKYQEESQDQPDESPGRTVTYKVLKGNWFVISGTEGDNIFYQKTILKGDAFLTFTISYPKTSKDPFDKITERIVRSFK